MLSPSFKAKRSRSQSPGQQNTFSVWVQEHTAGAAVMAVSALVSLSTVLQQHWDPPGRCFRQTYWLQSFPRSAAAFMQQTASFPESPGILHQTSQSLESQDYLSFIYSQY